MDSMIQQEVIRNDPDVLFRASIAHRHRTWARTFHSQPELHIQPRSIDEIRKVVVLARKCRRRLVTVGCAHSPSDLTCTSSWMVNLDHYDKVISVDKNAKVIVMQAGIRLHGLGVELKKHGLAMPNLGSIDHQSIAGAIGTGTHGSSTRHGLLSQSVLGLKIVLANGQVVACSAKQSVDLFRAALVSLGALGIIVEVTFQAVPTFNIEWHQTLHPLQEIVDTWQEGLWTKAEFTRVWWFPHTKQVVRWRADKVDKIQHLPKPGWLGGLFGSRLYHMLLYVAQWIPRILPSLESFVMNVQYGLRKGAENTGIQEGRTGLLMNCLYSQYVNEWALPLHKGPEAITRLSSWLNGDRNASGIPFDSRGLYVHAPIEVRVSDTSSTTPRPYLDNTTPDGPSLYLNATLYRPYDADPPCRERYYEGFEWLMKELGGKPHWAKNFSNVSKDEVRKMYPELGEWLHVRGDVDPEGMFVGDWHRRYLLEDDDGYSRLPLEEREIRREDAQGGGVNWTGGLHSTVLSPQTSEESFDMLHGMEAEKSMIL